MARYDLGIAQTTIVDAAAHALRDQLKAGVKARILEMLQPDLEEIVEKVVEQVTQQVITYHNERGFREEFHINTTIKDLRYA